MNNNPPNPVTEELKPCPFCGGEMQPRNALWPSDGDVDAIIHIGPSYCPLQVFSLDTADEGVSIARAWNERASQPPPHTGLTDVERVAREIDPDTWKRRDEDMNRREEWEAEIKVGWGDTTFEQWVNRFVGTSLEQARAAIAAMSQQPIHADEVERVTEAANRILSELDTSTRVGRFSRVEEADLEIVCRAVSDRSGVERLRNALKRLFEAGKRHDPDDWDGEAAMIEAAQVLGEPPFDKVASGAANDEQA